MIKKYNEVTIVLIDDDSVDREAVRRCFAEERILNPIVEAQNGQEGLDLIRRRSDESTLGPYIVLLDLNMPTMNGREFLKELRGDAEHKNAIVFVLTTSNHQDDIDACYDMKVSGYIAKQNFSSDFHEAIKMFSSFWKVVEFPSDI